MEILEVIGLYDFGNISFYLIELMTVILISTAIVKEVGEQKKIWSRFRNNFTPLYMRFEEDLIRTALLRFLSYIFLLCSNFYAC